MTELEEAILRKAEFKPYPWWRNIDDLFFFWEHGEGKLRSFINDINKIHPTLKFTAEWSKTSINFLDVTVSIAEGITEQKQPFRSVLGKRCSENIQENIHALQLY